MLTSTHINSILLYMTQIQYISTTHTSKDMAKALQNLYAFHCEMQSVA